MSDADLKLNPVGILSFLSEKRLAQLAPLGEFTHYHKDEVILEQDIPQNKLYFVVQGTLNVFRKSDTGNIPIGTISEGDCAGEISIFVPGNTTACVAAQTDCVLWYLTVDGLQEYISKQPMQAGQLLMGVVQLLSRRLRLADAAIASNHIMPNHICVRSESVENTFDDKWKNQDAEGFKKLAGKNPENYKLPTDIKW